MIFKIALDHDTIRELQQYGNLDDVVNDILQEGENGNFDLENVPKCKDRRNCSIYNINVTNDYYLSLVDLYGVTSSKISLRRIIYYFVDNNLAGEFSWKLRRNGIDTRALKFIDNLVRANSLYSRGEIADDLKYICEEIKRLRNEYLL